MVSVDIKKGEANPAKSMLGMERAQYARWNHSGGEGGEGVTTTLTDKARMRDRWRGCLEWCLGEVTNKKLSALPRRRLKKEEIVSQMMAISAGAIPKWSASPG